MDDAIFRRVFLARAAKRCLGVSFLAATGGGLRASETARAVAGGGKAKAVIYLFMDGAMSHLDTFDPKPGSSSQDDTQVTQTRIPGVVFGDALKRLAYVSDKLAVIRSLTTETGAHEQGRYLMRTAYKPLNSIRHPGLGAWYLHANRTRLDDLPGNVLVGNGNEHPGAGFLEPKLAPVPVANPQKGLENVKSPGYLPETEFQSRMRLINQFDRNFRALFKDANVEAYNQMYRDAVDLMGSERLRVFDITSEPEKIHEAYGDGQLGQGCLLARRLVEEGVPFVEVNYGGWDMHQTLWDRLPEKASDLDKAMGSLIRDLDSRGMLDETLVVLATEFGRSPTINENAGRDHHPGVFSGVLAGGGIRGGQVYGSSDSEGSGVDDGYCSVMAFNATIAHAAGLPLEEEFYAPNGRPFRIANGGTPIAQLFG